MAKVIRFCAFTFLFFCVYSCHRNDSTDELEATIKQALDSIHLNVSAFANYSAYSYGLGDEMDVYYITHVSSCDTSHRYLSYPINIDLKTGRIIEQWTTKKDEDAERDMVQQDKDAIETMFLQLFELRDAIHVQHIWYFWACSDNLGDHNYDFQVAFRYNRKYYILTHALSESFTTNIPITENWYLAESEDSPPHR